MTEKEPVTVAAESGEQLRTLIALRDTLARSIDACDSSRDLPALVSRMTDVVGRIADLAPASEVDAVDEIAARRNRRRSSPAKGSTSAKRSG